MKNGKLSSAEIAHIDPGWFAHWLMFELANTPADKDSMTRLILQATTELRQIRQSYPPARPQIGRSA